MDAIKELYKLALNSKYDTNYHVDWNKAKLAVLKYKYKYELQKLPPLSR